MSTPPTLVYGSWEWHSVRLHCTGNEDWCNCRYFSVEATQEMLDEWRPLLCPFDVKMSEGLFYLELFLPTLVYPHEYDRGFRYDLY